MGDSVTEIRERWASIGNKKFCETCMADAIRHYDRNMDRACDDYDDEDEEENNNNDNVHPGRYDGNVIAYAPLDIATLLSIIDKLTGVEKK